ncbi:MAG: hypothetical protein M1131_02740 [Actinobacteria bacterium]|nr:hypothetical protein [Actinomycetota bacterium]
MPGVVVTYAAPTTGASGSFSNTSTGTTTVATNSNGIATPPSFIANDQAGSYVVTAVTSYGTASFELTNTAVGIPASITAVAGSDQSTTVGTSFAEQLQAQVLDANGDPVSGVTVTFTAPGGGLPSGTFTSGGTSTQATTNEEGIAIALPFTANLSAGTYNVYANVSGLSTSAVFSLTNLPSTPSSMSVVSGNSQSAIVTQSFSEALAVLVTDQYHNPVPGVTVTFNAPTTGPSGYFNGGAAVVQETTNTNGIAEPPSFTANGQAGGPYYVTATLPGINPVQFALTNLPPSAYWTAATNGSVSNFGNASYFGSAYGLTGGSPVVSMAATPNGQGYWLTTANGSVFGFGNASYFGSAYGLTGGSPVVSMAATPNGQGYWLTTANGSVFGFGNASYFGSAYGLTGGSPVVSMAATPNGQGYWLTTANGSVFGFGNASYFGSAYGSLLPGNTVVSLAPAPGGDGYWIAGSEGQVFAFGDAQFSGATLDIPSDNPTAAIVSVRQPPT